MSTSMHELLSRARAGLRHHPVEKRVRASIGTETIVDSTRAVLVWEPRRICPSYAVPADDIRAELAPAPAPDTEGPELLHPGIPFSVHTTAGQPVTIADREGAGFRLVDPDLAGHVVLDFDAFDEWLEEDEAIAGHPRDPFHRVDVRQSSRPVRIEIDGEIVAETTRARFLFETGLPTRYYLPREDIRAELTPSDTRTHCPFKGDASYWSLGKRRDVAWSYEQPLADIAMIAGLVAFWDERVDVFVDDRQLGPPGGPFVEALRDEFGV